MPTSSILNDDHIRLETPTPLCYENAVGGIICFGVVNNPNHIGFKDVQVEVEMYNQHGKPISTQSTALLQRHLPPEATAPYHVLFDADSAGSVQNFGGVRVSVVNFTPLANTPPAPALLLEEMVSEQVADGYHLRGKLVNIHPESLAGVRLVITLYDTYEHVAGYRILEITDIPPIADMPFSTALNPQIYDVTLRYTVYLESMP